MTAYPVDVSAAGALLDPCRVMLPLQIVHGRSDVVNQPDAPTASFVWENNTAPGRLGDPVTVAQRFQFDSALWGDPGATWADPAALWGGGVETSVPRFAGYIDSMIATEVLGQVVSWEVGCVGGQATLGYRPITASQSHGLSAIPVSRGDVKSP